MNDARIMEAARNIANRRAALAWLEQYGKELTGEKKGDATVTVCLYLAGACVGAKEAAEVLSNYGRFQLPQMVRDAIECCRNDIAIETDAIRKEINGGAD